MGKTWEETINGRKILAGKPEMKRTLRSYDLLYEDIYYKIRPEKFYIPQVENDWLCFTETEV
jgi:hypothetical protein